MTLLIVICLVLSVHGFAKHADATSLLFHVGSDIDKVPLEPQGIPPFLHEYHTRAIDLTSKTIQDSGIEYIRDISYGDLLRNRLDIWKPQNDDAGTRRPVVVFLHGGGWDWGYKEWAGFVASNICAQQDHHQDAILVTPSYAIGKGQTTMWPDSRNDIVTVLQWLETNISAYGGDPSHIILAGHSAGGHLAASVGLNVGLLRDNGLDSRSIRGLFLISAPLGIRAQDFLPQLWKRRLTRPLASLLYRVFVRKVLRPVVGSRNDNHYDPVLAANQASPLAVLESTNTESNMNDIPFVHYTYAAKGDFPICRSHLERLEILLGPDKVQSLELPVENHFDTQFALADPACEWYKPLHKSLSE